jgi:DNA-binding MarR family transcriptional regulator
MIWAKFDPGDQRVVRDYLLSEPSCSETAVSLATKLGLRRGNARRALDQLVDEGLVRRRDFSDMASIYCRFRGRQ